MGIGVWTVQPAPVQVGTDTHWVAVAAGSYHSVAVKADGTLWGWGGNTLGQLGLGMTESVDLPTQVGTDATWAAVGARSCETVALRDDGTPWGWGLNQDGQLGIGATGQQNWPVQVGTDTRWTTVSPGYSHMVAIRTDGTLWAWGSNAFSQLGDGTTWDWHSPIQVVGGAGGPVPAIATFTASPATIRAGQTATLSFSLAGATRASIDQGVGVVDWPGSWKSASVNPTTTTTYTLTAANATGSVSANVTVVVAAATPLINGDFETGNLNGWTSFTTPNGMVSHAIGPYLYSGPNVSLFDTSTSGTATYSAELNVGAVVFAGLPEGGGIYQIVNLATGDLAVTADIASSFSLAFCNGDGGTIQLLVDGIVVGTHSFGEVCGPSL